MMWISSAYAAAAGIELPNAIMAWDVKKSNVPTWPGVLGMAVDNVPIGKANHEANGADSDGSAFAAHKKTNPSRNQANKDQSINFNMVLP